MSSQLEQSITALEFALKTEQDGEAYYRQVAKRTQNPLVRATFESLARDELFHAETIERFAAGLKASGRWADVELKARVSNQSGEVLTMFREAIDSGEVKAGHTSDDSEAYEKAAEFERKGGAFYKEQAEAAQDDAARGFWQFLVDEEDRHLRLIQSTVNFLDHTEDYYLISEHALIDGG